jgi:hypothetical protein
MTSYLFWFAVVVALGAFWVVICSLSAVEWWHTRQQAKALPTPYPTQEIAPGVIEYDLSEPLGDIPALPEDEEHQLWEQQVIRRMDAIEEVGERDGWQCGICHAPSDHLYFIELHDDGTLCCAVCAQILETGALE